MKKGVQFSIFTFILLLFSCNSVDKQLQNNIKMYSETWDEIINKGNLDLIDESHFTSDITNFNIGDINQVFPENFIGGNLLDKHVA